MAGRPSRLRVVRGMGSWRRTRRPAQLGALQAGAQAAGRAAGRAGEGWVSWGRQTACQGEGRGWGVHAWVQVLVSVCHLRSYFDWVI